MAPLSSISKGHGLRDAVAENTCPTLSLPGGQSSVCPFVAHLIQTWFPGRCRSKKCSSTSHSSSPFPKSVGSHCSPTTRQHCVIAAHIYKQARLFKCHCEKDVACSNLHIYSDLHSFFNLARRFSSSS